MSKSLRKAKVTGRAQGLVHRNSLQHHYLSQDWLLLRARKWTDIAIPPTYEFFKTFDKKSPQSLKESFLNVAGERNSVRDSRKRSSNRTSELDQGFRKENLRSSAGAYSILVKRWEDISRDYRLWKAQQELCDPIRDSEDFPNDNGERSDTITSDISSGLRAEPCRPIMTQDPAFVLEPVYPNVNHLDSLVDSQGRFPEESISSGEEAKSRAKELDRDIGLINIDRSSHQVCPGSFDFD